MNNEFKYELQAMHGEPLPSELIGIDIVIYYALCNVYDRFKNGEFNRATGAIAKKEILKERDSLNEWIYQRAELLKRADTASCTYAKNPTIENADRFFAAVYNLPNDWRLKRQSEKTT